MKDKAEDSQTRQSSDRSHDHPHVERKVEPPKDDRGLGYALAGMVALDGPIEPGEWTTIIPLVEDTLDNPLRADPWDRIDIGFLPGDVNDDGVSDSSDVDAIQACLVSSACMSNPPLGRMDIDRDGDLDTADKTRLVDVLRGINSDREWQGERLSAKP